MSLIRSKWTKPELWLHNYFKGNKIKHQMHPRIAGSPDIIFLEKRIALFLHGCFWHRCEKCYKEPSNNNLFWKQKVLKNVERDNQSTKKLQEAGWIVHLIWEHEINRRKPIESLKKITKRYK